MSRHKPAPGRAQHAALLIDLHPFPPQQRLLLADGDALPVLGRVPLEAAERAARRDDAVTGDLGREGVPPQRVPHGPRRRAQVRGHEPVRRDAARRDLAEERPHLLLEGRAVAGCDALQLRAHVFWPRHDLCRDVAAWAGAWAWAWGCLDLLSRIRVCGCVLDGAFSLCRYSHDLTDCLLEYDL